MTCSVIQFGGSRDNEMERSYPGNRHAINMHNHNIDLA